MARDVDVDDACRDHNGAIAAPGYCVAAWRQQVIILAVSAAAVLALALKVHMNGDLAALDVAQTNPTGNAPTVVATPVANESISSVRPVAASLRSSFNVAVDKIRPSTLAVRASYGVDANGQLLERAGSAVIVDAAGYAVTCSHVVSGASAINVRRFREPERWSVARAVASDGDLALLQVVDDLPFPAAVFGDSSRVSVGEWVLAVGYPFQLGLTVTAGIVSRRDATLTLAGGIQQTGLLQTDAAINEGSSGGPLINSAAEVVGINTAIYAPTGVFSGAGFAIASDRIREFVATILGKRVAATSWGLGLVTLTPRLATELAFPGSRGVVVSSVAPASAADLAQLAKGDVITSIAGQPVDDVATAMGIRERLAGNTAVTIEVWRLGVLQTVTLKPRAG
jgi:S1-C subfamily serine protease